jgi:hypothetical protein
MYSVTGILVLVRCAMLAMHRYPAIIQRAKIVIYDILNQFDASPDRAPSSTCSVVYIRKSYSEVIGSDGVVVFSIENAQKRTDSSNEA